MNERFASWRAQRWVVAAGIGLAACVIVLVYLPVFGFQLTGDDYQMAQFAHETLHNARLLLAPLGQFFRPLTNWSFMLDRLLWGTHPAGSHATTLLIHIVAAALLLLGARRLSLSPLAATVIALLWSVAPFTDENAVSAAIRHQNFLLIFWMALVLVWPSTERSERWTAWRQAGVAVLVVALLLTKESWVVTPALVFVIDLAAGGWRWKKSLKPAAILAVPAVMYTVLRFLLIPTTGGYFSFSWHPLLKVPNMLASFLWMEELAPMAFRLHWTGVLASCAVGALMAIGWRNRSRAAVVGSAFLFIPLLPTLFVPFQPQRYTAIPYAGFLLLIAGVANEMSGRLPERAVRPVTAVIVCVVVLTGAASIRTTRADLADWRRVSDAHARLLAEAEAVTPTLPLREPVLVVRMESNTPLANIARHLLGVGKPFFVRGSDPDGLIDAGALFDWVLDRDDVIVRRLTLDEVPTGAQGRVLFHLPDRFRWLGHPVSKLKERVRSMRARGIRVRIIEAFPLDPAGQPARKGSS